MNFTVNKLCNVAMAFSWESWESLCTVLEPLLQYIWTQSFFYFLRLSFVIM